VVGVEGGKAVGVLSCAARIVSPAARLVAEFEAGRAGGFGSESWPLRFTIIRIRFKFDCGGPCNDI
jgi:hypothetical protein